MGSSCWERPSRTNIADPAVLSCLRCALPFRSQCKFSIVPYLCAALCCCYCTSPSKVMGRHEVEARQLQQNSPGCSALHFPRAGGYHFTGGLPNPRRSERAEPAKSPSLHEPSGKVGVCIRSSSHGCKEKRRAGEQTVPSARRAVCPVLPPPWSWEAWLWSATTGRMPFRRPGAGGAVYPVAWRSHWILVLSFA